MKVLLDAGASVDTQDEGGWTALHCAALHGEDACVALLVQAGADPSVKDNLGRDCYHYAGDKRSVKALEALVSEREAAAASTKR